MKARPIKHFEHEHDGTALSQARNYAAGNGMHVATLPQIIHQDFHTLYEGKLLTGYTREDVITCSDTKFAVVGHGDVFEHNAKAQLKKGVTVLRLKDLKETGRQLPRDYAVFLDFKTATSSLLGYSNGYTSMNPGIKGTFDVERLIDDPVTIARMGSQSDVQNLVTRVNGNGFFVFHRFGVEPSYLSFVNAFAKGINHVDNNQLARFLTYQQKE